MRTAGMLDRMIPGRLDAPALNRNAALERQRRAIAFLRIAGTHGCRVVDLARACYVERATMARALHGPLAQQVVVAGTGSKRGRAYLREALVADERVRLDPDVYERLLIIQRALWFQRTIPHTAQKALILGLSENRP